MTTTTEPTLYRGTMPNGELLLTVYPDGTHEVAFRPDHWSTWDAPVALVAVKA